MSDLDDLRWSWIDRLRFWLRERLRKRDCDGCSGRFQERFVHPCSGDAWLCDKCLEEYMN